MSENGNTIGAFFMGLVMGAFFGAVMALLYAPEAGVELRTKLQSGAQSGWEKVQAELGSMKDTTQQNTDQTQEESPAAIVEG